MPPAVLAARGFDSLEQSLQAAEAQAADLREVLFTGHGSLWPHLPVDTTDGYAPGYDAILDFVLTHSAK